MEKKPNKESNGVLAHYKPEQLKILSDTKEYIPKHLLGKRENSMIDLTPGSKISLPKKADYRMRAHCNPLSDTAFPFPLNPDYVDWSKFYPQHFKDSSKQKELTLDKLYLNTKEYPLDFSTKSDSSRNGKDKTFSVDFIDIGCGYGGLLFDLSTNFPNKNSFGIEIRDKVVNYVGEKIQVLRFNENKYHNISVIRHNSMRHLTNFFRQNQLEKIFICFPDPHFKTKNHQRRIVNQGFLSEYAFVLKPGGLIYAITDVEELHLWHQRHLRSHSLFEEVSEAEREADNCLPLIRNSSEESQKVERAGGMKYACVFRCIKK
jgi:tRNA (guanine-N7-)-methyltransferase